MYKTFFLGLMLLSPLGQSHSQEKATLCEHSESSFQCVKYIRNYDADTLTVNVPGLHPLLGEKISIRVNGIDTPELRTKNKCEKEKAKIAKLWVERTLKKAKRIDLKNIQRGKYFRIVADVIVDGRNLTDILLEKGMGYPYDGGTKKKVNWCLSLSELSAEFNKQFPQRNTASQK
tara:strand:+ start:448 stop:972 length:525 start_codon:yes stop_codon:yes gene_type:complete